MIEQDKQSWGALLCRAPPLELHSSLRADSPELPLLHSADTASGEATALSTAGMQAAGWFLLEFVRSERTQETLLRILPKAGRVCLTRKLIFKSPQRQCQRAVPDRFLWLRPTFPCDPGKRDSLPAKKATWREAVRLIPQLAHEGTTQGFQTSSDPVGETWHPDTVAGSPKPFRQAWPGLGQAGLGCSLLSFLLFLKAMEEGMCLGSNPSAGEAWNL